MYSLPKFMMLGLLLPLTQIQNEQAPLDQVLTAAELQNYQSKRRYRDRVKVLRVALSKKTNLLRSELKREEIKQALEILDDMQSLAHHALQLSEQEPERKELRHKEVKRMEIRIRKTVEELSDLANLVTFQERPRFEATIDLLEKLRTQLLRQLFQDALGTPQSATPFSSWSYSPAPSPTTGWIQRGLHDIDKFTEEEFAKIQLAQELVKRVVAFLEIADSRLDEIERRRTGREWKEKEPNPLEFYSYEEMLFAYVRALEGIMVNIDEKARHKLESEKEIRKALKQLSEKVANYQPRLESLRELVVETQDERLARQLMEALKTSETAAKGAQYGLGAPPE